MDMPPLPNRSVVFCLVSPARLSSQYLRFQPQLPLRVPLRPLRLFFASFAVTDLPQRSQRIRKVREDLDATTLNKTEACPCDTAHSTCLDRQL